MNDRPYIIIGCIPRGGALFMQTALEEIGLDIGHEEPDKDGVIGWQHLCPSHPWTLKALRKGRGCQMVFMVQNRHPVDTINSIAGMFARGDWPPLYGGWAIDRMCNILSSDTPVMIAMKIYYHLNVLSLQDPKFKIRYKIEDIDQQWPLIMEAIGMAGVAMPDVPRNTNSRKHRKGGIRTLEWPGIYKAFPQYAENIERLALKMGYEVGDWDKTALAQWASEQRSES